ncbi:hypothetical protein N9L02_00515 [Gammaproteobacteria bacterium]|nr:hypothetical protein [Gammaproteobacteria bacterium]
MNFVTKYSIKKSIAKSYHALICLNKLNFEYYLKSYDLVSCYNKIYKQQIIFLNKLQIVRKKINNNDEYNNKLYKLEYLHEIICSIHLLKFRLYDISTLNVCSKEMHSLYKSLYSVLRFISIDNNQDSIQKISNDFLQSIYNFESLYENALCVVCPDPIIFKFFFQDLLNLNDFLLMESVPL